MIKLIVAVDLGNAIGWTDGMLAYRGLKLDMARFKALTTNSTVVMGMSTFKSLNMPAGLPNRKNIVLTRKPYSEVRNLFSGTANNIDIISSMDYVVQMAARKNVDQTDIWIIGGASVYDEALESGIVDEIHLTIVHATCEADVRLKTDLASWKLFVLRERKAGRNWEVEINDPVRDVDFYTTYLVLRKTA